MTPGHQCVEDPRQSQTGMVQILSQTTWSVVSVLYRNHKRMCLLSFCDVRIYWIKVNSQGMLVSLVAFSQITPAFLDGPSQAGQTQILLFRSSLLLLPSNHTWYTKYIRICVVYKMVAKSKERSFMEADLPTWESDTNVASVGCDNEAATGL